MHIICGVTGSVATTLVQKLVNEIQAHGHEVQIVATQHSTYFFQPGEVGVKVWTDADEWPNAEYQKDMPVEHIRLRDWADALVIAPLSANTLAKMASGICDNLLTCIWRAWESHKPIVLAPAMNTNMWTHPFTQMHLDKLQELEAYGYKITVVEPIAKRLACGDEGIGALANIADIVRAVG